MRIRFLRSRPTFETIDPFSPILGLAPRAQWDLAALEQSPQVYASGFPETNGVKSIFFDGEPYKGKPTRVFAYLAVPKVAPGTKVPGIVLVHGGLGSAFRRGRRRRLASIGCVRCGFGRQGGEIT